MEPTGRARVNTSDSRAFGVCDRCGIWWSHHELQYQYEWSGTQLYNKYLLLCPSCLDVPQQQLRTIVLPPDPLPILNARTENFAADEAGPTYSQITTAVAKGATLIPLQSVTGFSVDQNVLVQLNNGIFAEVMILSIDPIGNTISVSIPLPYSASPPNSIVTAALT